MAETSTSHWPSVVFGSAIARLLHDLTCFQLRLCCRARFRNSGWVCSRLGVALRQGVVGQLARLPVGTIVLYLLLPCQGPEPCGGGLCGHDLGQVILELEKLW